MSCVVIAGIELRRLHLPLHVPYRLSYRTFEAFEPILVRLVDDQGRVGFGEGHISPGSSSETRDGGWAFCVEYARRLIGQCCEDAVRTVSADASRSPVAASSMLSAIDVLRQHPLFAVNVTTRVPILTPTNATNESDIEAEVEQRLLQGFRTFKIKVGKDVTADLQRVRCYQRALRGRGELRLDANRAFCVEDGCRFAASLDAQGIQLFEQPCASEDWDGNARVAKASQVPLMLDEPICSIADVERAADIEGVRYCKVKLKRFVTVDRLSAVLTRIRELGLLPVLGDGLGCEPACWMEACIARHHIDNAGEFNGFLKPRARLFHAPLMFESGHIVLAPGKPSIDEDSLQAHTVERVHVGASVEA